MPDPPLTAVPLDVLTQAQPCHVPWPAGRGRYRGRLVIGHGLLAGRVPAQFPPPRAAARSYPGHARCPRLAGVNLDEPSGW